MGDNDNLPKEPVSKQEPVPKPAEPPKSEPQTPQPLTEERFQQLIAEATQKAMEQGKTLGKREMQGIKDKEVAEAKRQTRLAERQTKDIESSFGELDEETRTKMELARYKSRDKSLQELAQEEDARKAQETFATELKSSLESYLESLGIDPNEKGVDWATDAQDFLSGQKRFNASVAKIVKERQKTLEKQGEDKFKDMEKRFRKDLGLDSVDTTTGAGIDTSEESFRKKMADPNYVTTREDLKRIAELQKKQGG